LAFLYGLEGEVDQAEKYAELALRSDRYNARAYVNKVSFEHRIAVSFLEHNMCASIKLISSNDHS
jgi:hypothetical protein